MTTSTSLQSELTKLAAYPAFRLTIGNPRCLVVMRRTCGLRVSLPETCVAGTLMDGSPHPDPTEGQIRMQNRGTAHLRRGQLSPDEHKVRYLRLIVRDDFEYEIRRSLALYLLDGPDKAERLACSSRQHPYSGVSLIWRESHET